MSEDLTPRGMRNLLSMGASLRDDPEGLSALGTRYQVGDELGRGGMGVVYEAFDQELGRTVALKVFTSAAGASAVNRERFVREAKAAARLSHPNIARIYDATPEAIAMQRIDGTTLAEAGDLDPEQLVALIRDAALAIHHAHGEGLVHRDLKPANLMVERGDRPHVFVMDFGLAKEFAVDSSLSMTGQVVGTPSYMAPEQATGRSAEVGPATDVYGLGATLYACLAGRPPFEGDDVFAVLRQVVEVDPPPLGTGTTGVRKDLEWILMRCLAKEPSRRYASALELAGDLDRWLRGEVVQARPPSVAYRLRRFVSRRQGAILTGVVAAILGTAVTVPFVWQSRLRQESAEQVTALSQRVHDALWEARSSLQNGAGYETRAHEILAAAAEECERFLEREEVGHVRYFLGRLLEEQGDNAGAIKQFDTAEAIRPDIEGLRRHRGLVFAELYRDHVPVLGEDPPDGLETWRTRGLEDLEASVGPEPAVPSNEWLFAHGQRAWLAGDLDGAIDALREVVEGRRIHQEAHLSLTRLYLLQGRDEDAMRHSVIATDLLRGFQPAYEISLPSPARNDAEAVLVLHGIDELFFDFHQLSRRVPGSASSLAQRAQSHVRQAVRNLRRGARAEAGQSWRAAIEALDQAHELRADDARLLINRGACRANWSAVGSEGAAPAATLALALADYDRALELDPSLALGWFDRALLGEHQARWSAVGGRPDRVRAFLDRAREDAAKAWSLSAEGQPGADRVRELHERLRGSGTDLGN